MRILKTNRNITMGKILTFNGFRECDLVIQLLIELIAQNKVQKSDIGVITPYNAQVNLIRKAIRDS